MMSETIHALIIDDNQIDQKVLAQLLTMEGADLIQIYDPVDLVAKLQLLDEMDIVFVDLEMPHYNGYQVLELLIQKYGTSVPIVACTVHTSEVSMARSQGFHSFIGKPLNSTRFSSQVQRILRGESIWDFK
jgi:CheY-like chemotaxis protein